jgi:hypothetical protein
VNRYRQQKEAEFHALKERVIKDILRKKINSSKLTWKRRPQPRSPRSRRTSRPTKIK